MLFKIKKILITVKIKGIIKNGLFIGGVSHQLKPL